MLTLWWTKRYEHTNLKVHHSCERDLESSTLWVNVKKPYVDPTLTIMTPQKSIKKESQIDGRSLFKKTFEGTSKTA